MFNNRILIILISLTISAQLCAMQSWSDDFSYKDLPYNSVELYPQKEKLSPSPLAEIIDHMKNHAQKRSIIINRSINNLDDIQLLLDNGFRIHHSSNNQLYLTKWLDTTIPDSIPRQLSHSVGVGAMIINNKNEILVVKEKQRGYYNDSRIEYKIPTGYVEQQEEITKAIRREVKEEVGIDTNVKRLVGFWEELNYGIFKVASLYFVFLLEPKNESQEINIEHSELQEATWMPYEAFKKIKKFKPMHYFFAAYENPNAALMQYRVKEENLSLSMFLPMGIQIPQTYTVSD